MNRARRDSAGSQKGEARREGEAIDLGFALSIYSRDGKGRFVEIQGPPEGCDAAPFPIADTSPTEH